MESDIWEKIQKGGRLDLDDVRTLWASPDIVGLGWMADQVKRRRYGNQAFYVINQKIEPTNVCVLSCTFCDFATKRNRPDAYEMTLSEMVQRCAAGVREIHISGGMPPEWTFDHYLEIVRALRQACPEAGIKAFTAVEIEWMARISRQSIETVLWRLKEAGLTALPGGGAEVFSERVRQALFPFKIGEREWVDVHRRAHRLGIPSNATLLYGHIETPEERWHHLEVLRNLQDESLHHTSSPAGSFSSSPAGSGGGSMDSPPVAGGNDGIETEGNDDTKAGFMSFVPLAYQPGPSGLTTQPSSLLDDLKMLAIARLYLDNFPHIKAYWVTMGEQAASVALHFGADDVDGTIGEERIMHAAGVSSPSGLLRDKVEDLIRDAGCIPVERDALYKVVAYSSDILPLPVEGEGWGEGKGKGKGKAADTPSSGLRPPSPSAGRRG
ncbi:MAG: radical SAM protein [Elusimicrobiota bacterium]|jgi:aminodeoxyfutalosine synthase